MIQTRVEVSQARELVDVHDTVVALGLLAFGIARLMSTVSALYFMSQALYTLSMNGL